MRSDVDDISCVDRKWLHLNSRPNIVTHLYLLANTVLFVRRLPLVNSRGRKFLGQRENVIDRSVFCNLSSSDIVDEKITLFNEFNRKKQQVALSFAKSALVIILLKGCYVHIISNRSGKSVLRYEDVCTVNLLIVFLILDSLLELWRFLFYIL